MAAVTPKTSCFNVHRKSPSDRMNSALKTSGAVAFALRGSRSPNAGAVLLAAEVAVSYSSGNLQRQL